MIDLQLRVGLAGLRREWRDAHPGHGLAYDGPADFVLRHGSGPRVEAPALLAGVGQGIPGKCYANAIHAAAVYGHAYVEGFALHAGLARPVQHAWNVTVFGRLVDRTWAGLPIPAAYMGVAFALERADDCTWNGDATVLDDHHRGWPLLREPWEGEPPGLTWPRSDRIAALHAPRDGDHRRARLLYARGFAA